MLQRPTVANPFKSKNGFKILYTQISWGTLLTHREEDKRVRRGKDAAKGATVIFCRLAGGDGEELLALRVLLLDLVAIEECELIFKKTTHSLPGYTVYLLYNKYTWYWGSPTGGGQDTAPNILDQIYRLENCPILRSLALLAGSHKVDWNFLAKISLKL